MNVVSGILLVSPDSTASRLSRARIRKRRSLHMVRSYSSSAASLGGLQDLGYGAGQFVPGVFFGLELFAAAARKLVVFGAAIVFRGAPAGFDRAAAFKAMPRGVQRALLDLQDVPRDLSQTLGNGPPMLGLKSQSAKDQQ